MSVFRPEWCTGPVPVWVSGRVGRKDKGTG